MVQSTLIGRRQVVVSSAEITDETITVISEVAVTVDITATVRTAGDTILTVDLSDCRLESSPITEQTFLAKGVNTIPNPVQNEASLPARMVFIIERSSARIEVEGRMKAGELLRPS